MVFRIRFFGEKDAAHHLAKCLKTDRGIGGASNMVNQGLIAKHARAMVSERSGFQRMFGEFGADDEGSRLALGEGPGTNKDPVVGRALA